MNLTRQMQSLADLYSSVKPIEEKTYTPAPTTKSYSSTSDKNSNVLNEMYTNIYNKNTKKEVLTEAASESDMGPESRVRSDEPAPFGYGEDGTDPREKLILSAVMTVADTKEADDNINDLLASVNLHVKDKTGKALSTVENKMVVDSLKRLTKQEDEINVHKSDLNKDGKLSGYEQKRGAAIDKAMGGSGELPKGDHVSEATKSYSAEEAHKGKDIGEPGKQFKKIAKGAAKKYGSKKAGEKVAGAVLAKLRKEKFEFHGGKKNPNLMDATNYKLQKTKGFKPAGKAGKVASQTFLSADKPAPKTPFIKNSGPESDGVELPQKPLEPGSAKENVYQVNKFSQGVKKIDEKNINNGMSKSTFDKLFEDVMADDDAIALGATDAALDADMGGEADLGEDNGDVTLTIPRDVAEHLHALLSDILGGAENEMGEVEEGGEEGNEAGEEDEQNNVMGEEIEAEDLGHPLVNQKKGDPTPVKGKSNVVDSTVSKLAKAGKGGDGKVTDKVGNDGDEGHPLVNQTKGTELSNVKGKSNVVKSTASSKVGDTFFQSA